MTFLLVYLNSAVLGIMPPSVVKNSRTHSTTNSWKFGIMHPNTTQKKINDPKAIPNVLMADRTLYSWSVFPVS